MSTGAGEPEFVPRGYEIVTRLGAGQTSNVYLARHPVFGEVALKLPKPELAVRPVLKQMFENEVAITTKLTHPNVVAAHGGFPAGQEAYLALERCAGGTLDQLLLERGRLPLEHALKLVMNVAEGLEHAHANSVLHRDVKPANVFLTGDGVAKLGDFGTGVFLGEEENARVGTPFYMAPEVFEGRSAGVRSDVYSLGVLAYEVIAGERPFVGESYDALMVAHHTEVPKNLRHYRPELDAAVARVVSAAMARDPNRRFGSAGEFAAALRAAAGLKTQTPGEEEARRAPPTGRASRSQRMEAAPESPAPPAERRRRGLFGWRRRERK